MSLMTTSPGAESTRGAARAGRRLILPLAAGALLGVFSTQFLAPKARTVPASVEAAFDSDCETLLLREINRAQKEALVAIYSLTRYNIRNALADAARRGVKVHVKYDANQSEEWAPMKGLIDQLRERGVTCTPVVMPDDKARMHHKFAVIDGERVLTGSYNFTTAATEGNHENLVLISSAEIAGRFTREFESMK